jgi:hypothetical protein
MEHKNLRMCTKMRSIISKKNLSQNNYTNTFHYRESSNTTEKLCYHYQSTFSIFHAVEKRLIKFKETNSKSEKIQMEQVTVNS